MQVYPVEWGKSRKMRIRYLVPVRFINGVLKMPLNLIFGSQVASRPDKFEINIESNDISLPIIFDNGSFLHSITPPVSMFKDYCSGMAIKVPYSPQSLLANSMLKLKTQKVGV